MNIWSKPFRAVVLVVLILMLSVQIGVASASANKDTKIDLVAGSAYFSGYDATIRIFAKSGPSGENPKGQFYFNQTVGITLELTGDVTCVKVVGNRAVVGGVIVQASDPSFVGGGFLQFIEDNGSTGAVDRSQTGFVWPFPTVCPDPITPAVELSRGNYIVNDAMPPSYP